ncbi:hypothetical protein M8C21_030172 [Ambrosia artemisiifolia]|uniref:Terpene synthase metal-binding domain-containing protein n=1 Tax=Ambrosia artemisiifolia TaxID=4212 RepID=A0AAD5GAU4_AMBAR|nr:hypothetical protein M8C21_030172 [Ambrosia artemisiifolia]
MEGLDTSFSMNCKEKVEKLEEKVMTMLIDYEKGGSSTLQLLELIDDIERMGLGYRFQTNITKVLSKVASKDYEPKKEEEDNLHVACLKFRLLRQHGFSVSQGLASKLSFSRDRLMECFFWSVGMIFEPQYYSCRVGLTKVGTLITTIDDIYDVYGSMDELKIFTDAVKRWDINAMEHLSEVLQVGFLALYNTINQMGYDILVAQGKNIVPILAKAWGELIEAFFVEAKWNHSDYMPTLEDYLDNAWQSVSGVLVLTHGYLLMNQDSNKDVTESSMEKFGDLFKWSSMIFRLYNDLATSSDEMDRGKSINAISCYMHEHDVCEEVAREYIKTLIDKAWRRMIEARVACSDDSKDPFIDMAINLARISHCTYQFGDGHGAPDARSRDRVLSVIFEPITEKEH